MVFNLDFLIYASSLNSQGESYDMFRSNLEREDWGAGELDELNVFFNILIWNS